ncbi:MAG: hydratase [Burkholderiaceae bacterium]
MTLTAQALLDHIDNATLWPADAAGSDPATESTAAAYQRQLAMRALRIARGEQPRGFKIGFTNRTIWSRYNVFAPIWGTVWDSTLQHCAGLGEVSLTRTCQPRIEPEVVFGMRESPARNASVQDLFDAIDWIAPGFEVVQSHCAQWKFVAPDCVADGSLHARLLVGARTPVHTLAGDAAQLHALLAGARVALHQGDSMADQGTGANVLDSPLQALLHFLTELRQCPGAPDLLPGDVVTTGTWTDAWPVVAGERWSARFSAPLASLEVALR